MISNSEWTNSGGWANSEQRKMTQAWAAAYDQFAPTSGPSHPVGTEQGIDLTLTQTTLQELNEISKEGRKTASNGVSYVLRRIKIRCAKHYYEACKSRIERMYIREIIAATKISKDYVREIIVKRCFRYITILMESYQRLLQHPDDNHRQWIEKYAWHIVKNLDIEKLIEYFIEVVDQIERGKEETIRTNYCEN